MTKEDLINQRATTCRHGGHCEWVACDKCNHYEPKPETITNSTSGYLEVVLPKCDDCISRQEAINCVTLNEFRYKIVEDMKTLPSVTPKEKIGYCKDCKWWKDNDGVYRRGVGAESKCPINSKKVYEGNGYCYLFEPQESEDKE